MSAGAEVRPSEHAGWGELLGGGRLPLLALIWLAVWLTASDSLVTTTLMPSVGAELGGYAWFAWTVAGFMLGAILAGASAGQLSERIGLRGASMLGGVLFAAGCALSAVAPTMEVFVLGRLLQGVGGGWVSGLAMVAIARLFPPRHLARVFASVAGIWGVATVLGPLIGGMFAQGSGWRIVFWLFAAQAVMFVIAAFWLFDAQREPAKTGRLPLLQLLLLTCAVLSVGLADRLGGWAEGGAVALGFVLLGATVWADRHAASRILPLDAARPMSLVGSGYLAMFALTAASMGLSAYGPAILQILRGLTPLAAGYAVASMAACWTLSAMLVAGTGARGEGLVIRLGAGAILLGSVILALVMHEAELVRVILGASVLGLGFGLSSAMMNRRLLAVLPADERTIGSAALIFVRQTGNAMGAAMAGAAANAAGFGAAPSPATASAAGLAVFAAALPLALVGTIAAFRMTAKGHPAPPGA